MFSDYLYFSSYSASMLEHAETLAQSLVRERGLGAGSLVMEVASNDGYLLQYFAAAGVPVLGIEPAANVAAVARDTRSIPTLVEWFGRDLAAPAGGRGDAGRRDSRPERHGPCAGLQRFPGRPGRRCSSRLAWR